MEPMRIAIVPYDKELEGGLDPDLGLVANAIQRQVAEHLAPAWGLTAVVSAFPTLDHVPDGYSTVAITEQELPLDRGGFHYPDGGAGALVHYDDRWTINASHEALEMVVDPLGVRYLFGPSIADDPEAKKEWTEKQGLVEYVVEICDPVEGLSYAIDGVSVCDFVFPAFYDYSSVNDRYSFTYGVEGPFQLADGGYMSWAVERPSGGVYQAFLTGGVLQCSLVAETSTNFSRPFVDNFERALKVTGQPARGSGQPAGDTGQARGDRLRSVIRQQLRPADPAADPYVSLIDRLANNEDDFYDRCYQTPSLLLQELKKIPAAANLDRNLFEGRREIAPRTDYQAVSALYHGGHPLNYDFSQPEGALELAGMFSL